MHYKMNIILGLIVLLNASCGGSSFRGAASVDERSDAEVIVGERSSADPIEDELKCELSASKNEIFLGETVKIKVDAMGSDGDLFLEGFSIQENDERSFVLNEAKNFKAEIKNKAGRSEECSITVNVKTPDQPSCSIVASQTSVAPKTSIQISVNTVGQYKSLRLDGVPITAPYSQSVLITQTKTFVASIMPYGGGAQIQCQQLVTIVLPTGHPDLTTCLNNGGGVIGYPNYCPAGHVVNIINDGLGTTMTCCPVAPGVLSTKPGEQRISRSNTCAANEVVTGILTGSKVSPVTVSCTKVDIDYYATGASVVSSHRTASYYGAGSVMYGLINSYRIKDACVCPPGTVYIGGGHIWQDQKCGGDWCVEITKK